MNTGRRSSFCGTTFGTHRAGTGGTSRSPQCGREDLSAQGSNRQVFRSVPIGSKPVSIVLDVAQVVPEVRCDPAGAGRLRGWKNTAATRGPFARYAVELTGMATIQDVANHLCVGWDLIKELKKSDLARRYRKTEAPSPEAPGGRRNLQDVGPRPGASEQLVLDLDTGRRDRRVCRAGKGGADALKPFWKRLPGVAGTEDPRWPWRPTVSRAYTKAVQENLPQGSSWSTTGFMS